jgi:hypothetical protein
MTITPLSPSPNTAPTRRRYVTGSAHASPTATLDATFGRQNLEHQIPDRRADPIQGSQNQNPTGPSTSSSPQPANQIKQRRQISHRPTPAPV